MLGPRHKTYLGAIAKQNLVTMKLRFWLLSVLQPALVVVLAFIASHDPALAAEPKFPTLTGRVVDNADLISPTQEAELTRELAALEEKSSDQLVVVTVPSLQGYTIEDFGYLLGRYWGIGHKDVNNGVLLIVAPNDRKVRIEVGFGLEPQMTDIMSKLIIQNAILPQFRKGNFAEGIRLGVRDIKDVLLGDSALVAERRAKRPPPEIDFEALFPLIIFGIVFAWIIYATVRDYQDPVGAKKRREARRRMINRSSDNWGGGWSSRRGGGWSGRGGGFGGGGASGGW